MVYTAFVWREGTQWLAEFPDCPGCQTFTDSREELADMAHEALEGWLEAHMDGGEVPEVPKQHRASRGRALLRVEVPLALAVAVQIRQARAQAGLTQGQLAKKTGVSQQQIAKLERPGENPSVGTLAKVAKALGRSLDIEFRAAG